jgi:hypothetical protein
MSMQCLEMYTDKTHVPQLTEMPGDNASNAQRSNYSTENLFCPSQSESAQEHFCSKVAYMFTNASQDITQQVQSSVSYLINEVQAWNAALVKDLQHLVRAPHDSATRAPSVGKQS